MLKKKIKYQLKFKNYDQMLLNYNLLIIFFELKKKLNYINKNSITFLPYQKKPICILRAPFIHNVSREHFELRTFKTLLTIEILDPNNFLLEKLFETFLLNILKLQETTISYKKYKITGL